MALLEDAIGEIHDPRLREIIRREVHKLKNEKKFGLVFEEHLPELLPLYNASIKKGAYVARKPGPLNQLYRVLSARNGTVHCVLELDRSEHALPKDDVVVVKRFGEPIYPALLPVERVERAPGKPCHVLIEADNYHALQLLGTCMLARWIAST